MKHKQNQTIYLVTNIGNLDGTVEIDEDSSGTYDELDESLQAAKDEVDEYGMPTYIYKCIPIYKLERGKIKIKKMQLGDKDA